MDRAALDDFLRLDDEVRTMEEEVKALKAERDAAEAALAKQFEEDGLQNVKGTDGSTVFVHRQLWARAKDGDRLAVTRALESLGLTEFVTATFNTNQISAYCREQDAVGVPLPPELAEVLDVAEVFRLRVRRR